DGKALQALELAEPGTCLAADPTGAWLTVGTAKGTVAVFEAEAQEELAPSAAGRLHDGAVAALLFEAGELRGPSGGGRPGAVPGPRPRAAGAGGPRPRQQPQRAGRRPGARAGGALLLRRARLGDQGVAARGGAGAGHPEGGGGARRRAGGRGDPPAAVPGGG